MKERVTYRDSTHLQFTTTPFNKPAKSKAHKNVGAEADAETDEGGNTVVMANVFNTLKYHY